MLTLRHAALVFAGGTVGTALRMLVTGVAGGDVGVVVVNIFGAFVLGLVTALLSRSAGAKRRELQLLIGTGVLGGFTTYSALAVHATNSWWILWAAATVVAGSLAAYAGLALGARRQVGK